MTTEIIVLVDIQNGFNKYDIPQNKGGCLYVPGGEGAAEPAADLIARSSNKIFILSQDFHPENHISFMENHSGVMELRRKQLAGSGAPENLEQTMLNPTRLPFTNILLKLHHGSYRPIACEVGGKWHEVDTNFDGHVVHIHDRVLLEKETQDAFQQTLWRRHCQQKTFSTLFDEKIMVQLPDDLRLSVEQNMCSSALMSGDDRGNLFYVVRKGMRADLDSYGIATENDGVTKTDAPRVFKEITDRLKEAGETVAPIAIGGLATNFCTEYSHDDVYRDLVPALQAKGIRTSVSFLSDISFGIPIAVPGGAWPDLEAAPARMAAKGTQTATTADILRRGLKPSYACAAAAGRAP